MRNKWRIRMHFDSGTEYYFSVTLPDIAAFIKTSVAKNNGVKKHTTLPIDAWLVDLVFDKAMGDCPTANLMDATIFKRG